MAKVLVCEVSEMQLIKVLDDNDNVEQIMHDEVVSWELGESFNIIHHPEHDFYYVTEVGETFETYNSCFLFGGVFKVIETKL